jgi:hypothetical protein
VSRQCPVIGWGWGLAGLERVREAQEQVRLAVSHQCQEMGWGWDWGSPRAAEGRATGCTTCSGGSMSVKSAVKQA